MIKTKSKLRQLENLKQQTRQQAREKKTTKINDELLERMKSIQKQICILEYNADHIIRGERLSTTEFRSIDLVNQKIKDLKQQLISYKSQTFL